MSVLTTYKEIDEALQQEFVMILAKTHTCSACSTIKTVLQHNVPNLNQIDIHEIYIDDLDKFRGDHLIFSVPTVLIFSEGREMLRESVYINYAKIERLIDLYRS